MTPHRQAAGGDQHGAVYHDAKTRLVLVTWPCPRAESLAMDILHLTPADARHLATLLLGAAEKLEPSS